MNLLFQYTWIKNSIYQYMTVSYVSAFPLCFFQSRNNENLFSVLHNW
jgi:hypothetical protein